MPLRLRRGTNTDRLTVTPLEGELVYTTDTKLVYIGDGTTLGGNLVGPSTFPGTLSANLNLNGYDVFGTGNVNITGNITGTNLDINGNAVVNGNLTVDGSGFIAGTLDAAAFQGSLYSRNSSQVVDDAGDIYASTIYPRGSNSSVYIEPLTAGQRTALHINTDTERSLLKIRRSQSTLMPVGTAPAYADSPLIGNIQFESSDTLGILSRTIIQSTKGYFRIAQADVTGSFVEETQLKFTIDGFFGVGNTAPQHKLDVKGDAKISSNLRVLGGINGDLTGSVFADDSTVIVDAINSTITAGGFVQFGSYTKTERDSITAANGMVLYNTTGNRFQGYQNGAWINLDDGTADP